MKKVFLDNLPKVIGKGKKECINWSKSIGYKVKFIYDIDSNNRIEGELEIVNYDKKKNKLNIKYNNNLFNINTSTFSKCKLANVLKINFNKGKYKSIHKYEINEIIKTRTGEIKILEKIRIGRKGYKYECIKCGNIDKITESNINNKSGCNVCSGNKIIININDLWTTHQEVAKLLKYSDRGYELTHGSEKSEIFICPDCKYEKKYKINNIVNKGFSCPCCSDGISYPNKFAFNLLKQLKLDFIPEYNPDWIKPKKYDFYFELNNKGYILEMDGKLGHGNDNNLSGQTPEESKAIDDYKDMKAQENRIEVIRINSVKSDLEYIKNNLLSSKLANLFDLSNIDWLECHRFAISSRVKESCDFWNSGIKNTNEIGKIMKLSRSTIIRYLKQGVKFNWCDYDPKEEMKQNGKNNGKNKGIPVIQLSFKGEYIAEFKSATEVERQLGIFHTNIINCCNDKGRTAGGFVWMFKIDYENNKIISYENIHINFKKKIVQLSLNNKFISKYNGINEAGKITGIEAKNISGCCNKRCISTCDYRWMFIEDYELNINNLDNYFNKLKYKNNTCIKNVVQLSLDNDFIKEWNSINEAQKELHIKNISECCRNKRNHAGKFKWMYKTDYEKYIEEQNNIA